MDNFSIEIVVFGILILVILSDFFIKGFKKKKDIKEDSNLIENKKSADPKKTKKLLYFFQYLKERPRNVSLYIILVLLMKGLMSFYLNEISGYHIYNGEKKIFFSSSSYEGWRDMKFNYIKRIKNDEDELSVGRISFKKSKEYGELKQSTKQYVEKMNKYCDGIYYFFSPLTYQNVSEIYTAKFKILGKSYDANDVIIGTNEFDSIKDHFTYILRFSYLSFLYAFILTGFLTWQLNPYIKKR